jgi:hypothetical protein
MRAARAPLVSDPVNHFSSTRTSANAETGANSFGIAAGLPEREVLFADL